MRLKEDKISWPNRKEIRVGHYIDMQRRFREWQLSGGRSENDGQELRPESLLASINHVGLQCDSAGYRGRSNESCCTIRKLVPAFYQVVAECKGRF